LADWAILQSPEFRDWYRTSLTDDERDAIVATALRLQADGPALRRPLSGIIKGSKFPNMKELIPPPPRPANGRSGRSEGASDE